MWYPNPSSPTKRLNPCPEAKAWSPNHWTIKEVPSFSFQTSFNFFLVSILNKLNFLVLLSWDRMFKIERFEIPLAQFLYLPSRKLRRNLWLGFGFFINLRYCEVLLIWALGCGCLVHLVWLFTPRLMLRYFGLFLCGWFFWGLEIGTAQVKMLRIITVQMRFAEIFGSQVP